MALKLVIFDNYTNLDISDDIKDATDSDISIL